MNDKTAVPLPLRAKVPPSTRLYVIKIVLHMVYGVVLVAGFTVHAGESFHGLDRHKVTAVLVL